MKFSYIYILAVLFLFSSCEDLLTKEIELEDVGFEPQLVLNSNVNSAESKVQISLTKNISLSDVDDTDYALIKNADIKFKVDGQAYEVETYPEPKGIYGHFVTLPEMILGKTIEITASKEGYKDIRSTTVVPKDFSVVDLSYEEKVIGQDSGGKIDRLKFAIEDDVNAENFYEFKAYAVTSDTTYSGNGDTSIIQQAYPLTLESEVATPVDNDAQSLYSDVNFNGLKYTFTYGVNTNNQITNKPFEVLLSVTSLSKSKYLHKVSVDKYRRNQDFGFFSEPVTVYTNVENGLGALSAEHPKVYKLK